MRTSLKFDIILNAMFFFFSKRMARQLDLVHLANKIQVKRIEMKKSENPVWDITGYLGYFYFMKYSHI